MSVAHIREELTKLQEEINSIKTRFDQDTTRIQYYLLEASYLEEEYWTKIFRGIRARAELISNIWEAEVLLFQVVQEDKTSQDKFHEQH